MKDAFHRYIINNEQEAVNPDNRGTKVAAVYFLQLDAGQSFEIKVKLDNRDKCDVTGIDEVFNDKNFDEVFQTRKRETDEFYATALSGKKHFMTAWNNASSVFMGVFVFQIFSQIFFKFVFCKKYKNSDI